MGNCRNDDDEEQCGKQPVRQKTDQRESEHVETDIGSKLRIGDAERLRISEEEKVFPLLSRRQRHQDSEQSCHPIADESHAATKHLMEALHDRRNVIFQPNRCRTVGNP